MKIHLIKLRVSNAYLLVGVRPILVDTGAPHDTAAIRAALQANHVDLSQLALILHTHVHSDHMGSTADIAAEARCPVTYHPADQPLVDRGDNGRLTGIGLRGNIMSRLFSHARFQSVPADFPLSHEMRLDEYGVEACVMHTPGHTAGSVSVIADSGDGVIGDVLMGGYMGGNFLPTKPNYHYFAENLQDAMHSLDLILSRTSGRLFVGHGGPLQHATVARWRASQR